MKTSILIAIEHTFVRLGLQRVIDDDPQFLVVGHALDMRTLMEKMLTLQPDVLVMDLQLPGAPGVDGVHQVRRRRPQQKVLALGDCRTDIEAGEALRAGCGGYLLRNASQDETLRALRAVQAGRRYVSEELADQLLGEALRIQPTSRGGNLWESLSTRERSVFRLIAGGNTNRSAATALSLSPKTIEKHRANLMRKLQARNAVELMLIAVELGLVERPTVAPLHTANGHMPPTLSASF